MHITMSESGNSKDTLRFLHNLESFNPSSIMNSTGRSIVSSLQSSTPRRTGATARGWKFKVEKRQNGDLMYVYNDAHPESASNVARLIDTGHGTRTGGYVPGFHYIKPASHGLLQIGAESILKAVSR